MQTSSTSRSILTYGLVCLVLLGAIFLGIQLVKNRNTVAANPQPGPVAEQPAKQEPQPGTNTPPAPANTPPAQANSTPSTTPGTTPKTSNLPTPARVPATGNDDVVIATLALAGLVFASLRYAQSRRRLMTLG